MALTVAVHHWHERLSDAELERQEVEERRRARSLERQILELQQQWQRHDIKRRRLARERLHRVFSTSAFGRLIVDTVLPFLHAREALRWFCASAATARQLCWPHNAPLLRRLHHLHGIAGGLQPEAAANVVHGVHWPSLRTLRVDLRHPGWAALLEALGSTSPNAAPRLVSLESCAVLQGERPLAPLKSWRQQRCPQLLQLAPLLRSAPLRELLLTDLYSTEILTALLAASGPQLAVCRASFLGPESRKSPLELPREGLPALECLLLRHRDFAGQRASRRDRMRVAAAGLLACLNSSRRPEKMTVLALTGICIEGDRAETAALLEVLPKFTGLAVAALRFSLPNPFGRLLPLPSLLALRRAWPRLFYFTLSEMALHGFDYWPEQITDFQQLYAHGGTPNAIEVFRNEFGHALSSEYGTTAEAQWWLLPEAQQGFWRDMAARLPAMPHSEVRSRVAALFPSCLCD